MFFEKYKETLLRLALVTSMAFLLSFMLFSPANAEEYDCGAYGAGGYGVGQICTVQDPQVPEDPQDPAPPPSTTPPEPPAGQEPLPQAPVSPVEQPPGDTPDEPRNSREAFVPPRLLPLLPLIILLILALLYMRQSWLQNRANKLIAVSIQRIQATKQSTDSYIDIASHYFNTPFSTMKGSLELMSFKGEINSQTLGILQQRLDHLGLAIQKIISQYQALASEPIEPAHYKTIHSDRKRLDKGLIIPTAVSLLLVVVFAVLSQLFYSVEFTVINLVFWAVVSAAALGLAVFAFYTRAKTQNALKRLQTDSAYKNGLIQQRLAFIHDAHQFLSTESGSIRLSAALLPNTNHAQTFTNGLAMLENLSVNIEKAAGFVQPVSIQSNNMSFMVEELVNRWKEAASKKQIALTSTVQPDLTVYANDADIAQLVDSVISNAIKFSPTGGAVAVDLKRKGRQAVLSISDTGPGMTKEQIENLFKPFYRATDTKKYNYEGLGLSFYIDKIILDRLGGTMQIDSQPGSQTTVKLAIPLSRQKDAASGARIITAQTQPT